MILDLIVVAAYFALILWIGLSKGSREKTLKGYALADRSIPWWAVVASILAAEISAATFLGTPTEGFEKRNFTYAQLAIGVVIARALVAVIFVRKFYELGVVSIYEYLEIRFGSITRCAGSIVFLLTRILASGTRLYVAAIFLVVAVELQAGHPPTTHQELMQELMTNGIIMVVLILLTAAYTTIGGIKAVVWTDFIQAGVLILSLFTMLVVLLWNIPGGWNGAMSHLDQPGDLQFFHTGIVAGKGLWENIQGVLLDEYTIFAALLGSVFVTLATHGTDQDMVQRMLTAKSSRQSQWSVVLSGLADFPLAMAFLFIGILLNVFYSLHTDPHLPVKTNQILPYFVLTQMPSGLRGLIVAALLATAMGSMSTALNSLATSFSRDFYFTFVEPHAEEKRKLFIMRIATVAFAGGLIFIALTTSYVAILHPKARILPIVLGSFGYTYGSLLGVFLTGLLTKTRGNDFGNIIGMIAGFIVVALMTNLPGDVALFLGITPFPLEQYVPQISFPWRVMFGCLVTFGVCCMFRSKNPILKKI